ncbi:MAG: peptidylprolyl isomerase [Candidatus Omnitrophica bacterium]|nr:peptidylprolyl isomerase [Candidatus Omnitrophota bacterium]
MRKKVGWIAGAAIAGFLLWLVGTVVSLQATQAETAGFLFGRKIPFQTYQRALEAATHQAILTHGEKAHQEVSNEELGHQAWERLMLLREAKRLGIQVSDREIIEELKRWPIFQRDGQFDRVGYQAIVQYTLGTSPRAFEEEIRENLTLKKLFEQALPEPRIPEQEIHKHFLLKETSIQVSTLTLSSKTLAQEIAEAARQRPEQLFKAAEQMNLKVVKSDFFKGDSNLPELGKGWAAFEPLFSMEPGQVAAAPLSGPKGWLVAKLEGKQLPDERIFPEMKESIEKELANRKRFEDYFKWYQDLRKRADLRNLSLPRPAPAGKNS